MSGISDLLKSNTKQPAVNAPRLNILTAVVFLIPFVVGFFLTIRSDDPTGIIIGAVVGILVAQAPQIAQQWERAVILRLGRYRGCVALVYSGSSPLWMW